VNCLVACCGQAKILRQDYSAGCASVDIIRQRVRLVNFPERFGDSGGIDTYRAGLLVRIGDVERQRLDVAVKNDPDE
jgi:hypothetical protein